MDTVGVIPTDVGGRHFVVGAIPIDEICFVIGVTQAGDRHSIVGGTPKSLTIVDSTIGRSTNKEIGIGLMNREIGVGSTTGDTRGVGSMVGDVYKSR